MMHLENYGPYREFVETGKMKIDVRDINNSNYNIHFESILNIMRDSIETDFIREHFITIYFNDTEYIELTIIDYYFNLILWYVIIVTDNKVTPKHIVFEEELPRWYLKKYIDEFFIEENLYKLDILDLNNIIDDCYYMFTTIDEFSFYLANTINNEDFIDLMNENYEFYQLMHCNLNDVPLDLVNKTGMDYMKRGVEIMKNSDHCFKDFFRASEGINKKQLKEFAFNLGVKPDGRGGVYPIVLNKNFMNGGVNDIVSFVIESSIGRIAQIMVNNNVGKSGYLARKLGLNNTDTYLHHDSEYICDSKNFQTININSKDILMRLIGRYYRFTENGMEYKITRKDTNLIGKTVLLRSPMTCASNSRGEGICHRCYGELTRINKDINIGKIAAELLSAALTQMMLSAKHLLEASVQKLNWKKEFDMYFEIEYNMIKVKSDINVDSYKILIDPEKIELENEDDDAVDVDYNEYITEFSIIDNKGNISEIYTTEGDHMYITIDLNDIIRKHSKKYNGCIMIDLKELQNEDISLFTMRILNNDLSKLLNTVKNLIDTNKAVSSHNKDSLLQVILERLIEGGMKLSSVHLEVILSNQLRSVTDILQKPEWEYPNEPYNLLSLTQSLNNHPSVTISMSYENIDRVLYNPLTFRKNAPSFMDLFFMKKPQEYLSNKNILEKKDSIDDKNEVKNAFIKVK